MVTPLVVFGFVPTVVEVTVAVIVHPPAGKLGTFKLREVSPTVSAGLLVTPEQVPPMVVEEILIPLKVSVKVAFVKVPALGFVNVNVIVDVPPD